MAQAVSGTAVFRKTDSINVNKVFTVVRIIDVAASSGVGPAGRTTETGVNTILTKVLYDEAGIFPIPYYIQTATSTFVTAMNA